MFSSAIESDYHSDASVPIQYQTAQHLNTPLSQRGRFYTNQVRQNSNNWWKLIHDLRVFNRNLLANAHVNSICCLFAHEIHFSVITLQQLIVL